MYVCGPTVYDEPHLGHVRSAYVFDVLRRHLARIFRVRFARNVTDVDDKIIEKARQDAPGGDLNVACSTVAARYLASYHQALALLGVQAPDVEPKATEHVVSDGKDFSSMVDLIAKLVATGAAYEVKGGSVYFAVRKFPRYGALSNRTVDELQAGTRVEPGEGKQDPLDFALWKAAKPGEPSWPSPWGAGRPGWHIECSVMSMKYLGEAFDIHGGGLDLIFPHHENEIAQAHAAGKPFAKYWIHHGLVTVNSEKMSKSLGNFVTVEEVLKQCNQHADVLKMFFLSAHYRSPLNYTPTHIAAARQHYENYRLLTDLANSPIISRPDIEPYVTPIAEVEELAQTFFNALDDDLNTPEALSALDRMRNLSSRLHAEIKIHGPGQSEEDKNRTGRFLSAVRSLAEHGKCLGLFEKLGKTTLSKQIDGWFEQYKAARIGKDFKTSDTLRKKLNDQGFIVQDTGGTSIIIPKH